MIKEQKKRGILIAVLLLAAGMLAFALYRQEPVEERFFVLAGQEDAASLVRGWRQQEEGVVYFFLPSGTETIRWQPKTAAGYELDGSRISEGEAFLFEPGKTYGLCETRLGGILKEQHRIRFLCSQQVPSLWISTDSGTMDYVTEKKGNRESGSLTLLTPEQTVDYAGAFAEIKGRGNYTWLLEKKSFSITFREPVSLLTLGADTEWVLLAGAAEDTHLINRMTFEMMRQAGVFDVPGSTWVDLYCNGMYAGNYLLSQKVKPQEVDPAIEWMVEFDGYWKEEGGIGFETDGGEQLAIVYPETADAVLQEKIRTTLQRVENAVLSETGLDAETGLSWEELVDAPSLVKKYLLDEISKCPDGWNGSNYCYFKKGRLYFGAPWDYEFSFGNQPAWFSYMKLPQGLSHQDATAWYRALYKKAAFANAVKKEYRDFFQPYLRRQQQEMLDEQAEQIAASMELDRIRWGRDADNFETKLAVCKAYIQDRLDWLDQEWLGRTLPEETAYHKLTLQNGTKEHAVYYIRDGALIEREMLEWEDESFCGWYTDSACTTAAEVLTTPVTKDLTLYAGFDYRPARIRRLVGLAPPVIMVLVLGVWVLREIAEAIKRRR